MDPRNVQIQVWTEFVEAPVPLEKQAVDVVTNAVMSVMVPDDEVLTFGAMSIGRGKAFNLSAVGESDALHVGKYWERRQANQQQARQFLIESVPWTLLAPKLQPLPQAPKPQAARPRPLLQQQAQIPSRAGTGARTKRSTQPIQMARADLVRARPGVVIDYSLINNGTYNLTLQSDTTYYVSGYTVISGVTRIEGGTVVKYANTNNAQLKIQGTIQCQTGP